MRMPARARVGAARWLCRALVAVGAGLVAAGILHRVHAEMKHEVYRRALDQGTSVKVHSATTPLVWPALGDPIGTLDIPRLGLSRVVLYGDSESVLSTGIGHLPDTPLPWNGGNTALSAHRDTFFRPLRHVRAGDVLRLRTPHGNFEYRVRDTLIVDPEDVWVLQPSEAPLLTLITCYPFNFVGSAPQRFIVRADRVEPVSTSLASGPGP